MKARTAIKLWILASLVFPVLGIGGALFKIQHWPFAWVFEVIGWLFSAGMSLIVAVKVLRFPGFKDFLDS